MTDPATLPSQQARAAAARVYIAARFSRRPECNQLGHLLKQHGCVITSRWTKPDCDHVLPTGLSRQAEDSERQRFALEDVDDVRASNWMISLMEEPRSNTRGGRHIEFGIALALGHRLTIIGPRETVFHHLPQVEHFETVEAFIASLPASLSPKTTPEREDIARIIDPRNWALHDQTMKEAAELTDIIGQVRADDLRRDAVGYIKPSLATADKILASLSPVNAAVEDERAWQTIVAEEVKRMLDEFSFSTLHSQANLEARYKMLARPVAARTAQAIRSRTTKGEGM